MLKCLVRTFFFAAVVLGASFRVDAAETLYSYSDQSGAFPDSMEVQTASVAKCVESSGSGATCYLKAPGFEGALNPGEAVGIGPGTAELSCAGAKSPDEFQTCTLVIDNNTACTTTQNLSAYSRGSGGSYPDSAPVVSPATVTCTSVFGASGGRCQISGPGVNPINLNPGQSVGTSGPGTVTLWCTGYIPVGQTLSCTASVVQSCP